MVLIHLKQPDGDEFLYEAPSADTIENVATELATIHNMRLKLRALVECVKQLAAYGPMKPEAERGLSESQISAAADDDGGDEKADASQDPHGIRVGVRPQSSEVLMRTADEAGAKISPNQMVLKTVMTKAYLQEGFDLLRGAVMIAYPMGLPEFDVVRTILEDRETFAGHALSKDLLDPKTCLMWWAGKQLARAETLGKFVGRNEKTKIVAKLTKKGSGAPAREAPVDAETQKNMMAFYHKKQQEMEKLEEDSNDSYLNSDWANPRGLKNQFSGIGDIKWRPGFGR